MNYSYEAELVKVIDGDSVVLTVLLGFNLEGTFTFQLAGLDAPELIGNNACSAKESKKQLQEMLRGAARIVVRPTGLQTGAGRWWASIDALDEDGKGFCVNEMLLQKALAKPIES